MNAIRAYKIRWSWRRYGRVFSATTTWLFNGDARAALDNFFSRTPDAIGARVLTGEEAK
jgi:hypothetical protein